MAIEVTTTWEDWVLMVLSLGIVIFLIYLEIRKPIVVKAILGFIIKRQDSQINNANSQKKLPEPHKEGNCIIGKDDTNDY
ncbi:MAG: hypothetical protein Q7J73_07020 [Dehalococcoidales bacterium]|nr:hypothetical protein [Dehalococcoidales bacterium]